MNAASELAALAATNPKWPLIAFFALLFVGLIGHIYGVTVGRREALDINTNTLGQWLYEHLDPKRADTDWDDVPADLQQSYAASAGDLLDELSSVR